MITIRRSGDRGTTRLPWLDSRHSFSFGDYYDPEHMGFGFLRVINEDRVAPGGGFAPHGHRDMEIISYVVDGALAHKDSLGTGSIIRSGEIQRMSAGTGIRHSEFNASKTEPVHFLQIWILPARLGAPPAYEQVPLRHLEPGNGLRRIATPDGEGGTLLIGAPVTIHAARLAGGEATRLALAPGRLAWAQIVRGAVVVNGHALSSGDGAAMASEPVLEVGSEAISEVLLIEMDSIAAGPDRR